MTALGREHRHLAPLVEMAALLDKYENELAEVRELVLVDDPEMAAEARAEQARYAYERLRLDIGVELRGAINTARQANEGLTVAKTGLESAEEDLKLSQEKYNVGSGTILELLDAQVNLQRSRQQYVVALTAARIAEAQIERARGVIP